MPVVKIPTASVVEERVEDVDTIGAGSKAARGSYTVLFPLDSPIPRLI